MSRFTPGQKVTFTVHGPGFAEPSEATVRSVAPYMVTLEEHPTLGFDPRTGREIDAALPGFWSEIAPVESEATP